MHPTHSAAGACRLAIFDFDGTLFDTRQAIAHTVCRTFVQKGRSAPTPAAVSRTMATGVGINETFHALSQPNPLSSVELPQWVDCYREIYRREGAEQAPPFGDPRKLFRRLVAAGIQIAVVSNKGVAAIECAVRAHDLASHVALVVGDDPKVAKKPDPMAFHQVIEPFFGAEVCRMAAMVGDTTADIEFARNIGAHSCWASYGYGDPDQCQALLPDRIISSLDEAAYLLGPMAPSGA
jgi:phosphoglycolate phosphatase